MSRFYYDTKLAELFEVTPMTVGRWRRGVSGVSNKVLRLAELLVEKGELDEIPSWMRCRPRSDKYRPSYDKRN